MDLYVDLETRGDRDLPRVGVHVYAETAEILLTCWAIDNGAVQVDEQPTEAFWDAFYKADRIVVHNGEFDRTMLTPYAEWGIRFDHWYCTMSQARRHGLPGGLAKLCEIFNLADDEKKLADEGRRLLMLFCKPRPDGSWAGKHTHPAEWGRFKTYGGRDVVSMRKLHSLMPKWNDAFEQPIWLADQRTNLRGFAVDTQFAEAAVKQLSTVSRVTDLEVAARTDGEVGSARQVQELIAHILRRHGVDLPDMKAETLERRIADPDLPDEVRQLLALRQQSAKTSTSKYKTLLKCTNTDGRLRGALTYCGAMRTKRWAGNRFQAHNLPRPAIGKLKGDALKTEIRAGIAAIKAGVYDLVGQYPLPVVAASAVRGCVVPGKGKKLVVGDYSNVEGRGLAWLAGEQWKLDLFRELDAHPELPDLYKRTYGAAFGVDPADVDDGMERQVGKVMELMLGYGGGVGAFVTGASTYRVDLNRLVETAWPLMPARVVEETLRAWEWAVKEKRTYGLTEMVWRTCDGLKRLWRARHLHTVQFWSDLEDAFRAVCGAHVELIDRPRLSRLVVKGGKAHVGCLTFDKVGAWVRIKGPATINGAPSYISYPGVRIGVDGKISYLGQNQYTRVWSRIGTYAGKLAENCTQWLCRDLIAQSHLNLDGSGLDLVLHVHDEDVAEVDQDVDDAEATGFLADCMTDIPWAPDLPLAVAAHVQDRYGKT